MTTDADFCNKLERIFEDATRHLFGQISDFHMCNLGMCFLAAKEAECFTLHEFELNLPEQSLRCQCAVVGCEPENETFRTHIHFLDVPAAVAACVAEWSHTHNLRCPHCANH